MTLWVRAQQPGRSLGVLVLFLVISGSSVALASRPLDHAAQLQQQQQQHKGAQHIQQLTQQVASSINSLNRQLRQSATCPEGCDIGGAVSYCQQDSTSGALRCSQCLGNLFVNKADGTCVCPPGKFSDGTTTCRDCTKGSWCPGGTFSVANPPPKVECPSNMTTLGLRAVSARSCVNMPGYSYAISGGEPSATICPENTYGPGLKKQRACVPCVPGFSTVGVTGARVPTACVVPPGYFLKGPGQVAPCPQGEWKAGIGTDGNCTRCAMGVTTEGPAATSESNCTILAPGYYAKSMRDGIVTEVAICPQSYYCSGGRPLAAFDPLAGRRLLQAATDDTIKRCPDGTWTQNVGATNVEQCLTPPGYKTADGATVPCGPNEFRAEWKLPAEAASCQSCGVGVSIAKTDRVVVYDPTNPSNETQISVATSADDCFIQAGQGLLFQSLEGSWRAVNCDSNNYGAANETYGLTPTPCRACPQDMVTSKDRMTHPRSARWYHLNADSTGGFVSNLACVTQAGWGYNGRNSYKCEKGFYNAKDTLSACKRCAYGMTTAGIGVGVKESDCGIAPGFGFETGAYYNLTIMECPIGKYNDAIQYVRTTPCTQCPIGTTNARTGADSKAECDRCLGGWGFKDCATQCGGGTGSNATYGPPDRDYGSPCISCNDVLTSFSYNWMTDNDVWTAPVTARLEADNPVDCLAEFTQVVDGAFYVPAIDLPSNRYANNVTSFSDCVATCGDGCALVTYDYLTNECWALYLTPSIFEGDPYIAFKNFQAGSTQASSVKNLNSSAAVSATVRAKSGTEDYGTYGWFRTPDAPSVGIQKPAPGRENFLFYQDCMDACDFDSTCIGVMIEQRVPDLSNPLVQYNTAGPWSCLLVFANTRPGTNKRTVVRANIDSVEIPQWTGVCREMPNDVIHGKWPTSCAGKPPGWVCQAECDCSPEECYSRDGCPTTICIKKADGSVEWGPFTPPECTLAIPAQPPAISCPTPLLEYPPMPIWYEPSRRRSLLGTRGANPAQAVGRRSRALRSVPAGARHSDKAPGRSLLAWEWDTPYNAEFTAVSSFVSSLCKDPTNQYNLDYPTDSYQFLEDGTGFPQGVQVIHDSGVCAQRDTKWFTGIAAQDFTTDGGPFKATRKWEQFPKNMHKSYVWTKFRVPLKPEESRIPDDWLLEGEYNVVLAQGIQLVVVGNVGADHPCQANCAVTAVDVAFYENNRFTGEPMLTKKPNDPWTPAVGDYSEEPWYTAMVNLDHTNKTKSFNWQQNATAVLNIDLYDLADNDKGAIRFYENTTYWVRLRLVVPFNGTDDSGWARCYGYIGLAESASIESARWQEAGGYNSSCGPFGLDDFPVSGQSVGNCVNNGGVNGTTLEACTAAVTSQTCAVAKYGPDSPRSCPFGGQDILWSIWGNADGGAWYDFFDGLAADWGLDIAAEGGGPDLTVQVPPL